MTTTSQRPDPEEDDIRKSHLGFPVVGIGASAGGIAALQKLFELMPSSTGMAFVVVIHLSPTHESALAGILQRTTRMPVVEVVEATPIEVDHIYVISPSKDLRMSDGGLQVSPLSRPEGRHTAIDLFFRSLAQAHQERSIAIVLTGTGSDGTQGLKRLKEMAGVTLAQSPDDAEFDAMPSSAIATGLIDIILPVVEMPKKLAELWTNVQGLELPEPPPGLLVIPSAANRVYEAEEALVSIKALLRERTGHDFSHYKRATVLRRLERRMQVAAVSDLVSYRRSLENNPNETQALLQDLLISVTTFFRDRDAFESLERILMEVAGPVPQGRTYRAWVAGCATGEEAFSLAMLLTELMDNRPDTTAPIQIFASDIDQRALVGARAGLYPKSIATDVSPMRLRLHFNEEASGYRVVKRIRESVLFSVHNVLRDPPFTRVNLICCRNLLIYLDRHAQMQILRAFAFSLNPGGLLFLGNSESVDAVDGLFSLVDKKHRIYRLASPLHGKRSVSMLPMIPGAPITVVPVAKPLPVTRPPLQELHERVRRGYAAPTVLVDPDQTVLHVDDRAAHLLRVSGGAPSTKLLDLVRPELRVELRTALFNAQRTSRSTEARHVALTVNGQPHHLYMSVRPVSDGDLKSLLLITFDECEDTFDERLTGADDKDPVISTLEAELLETRAQLTSSAGEAAVSTEELRASNEELQTINEELRSATEELETSREELQSVNEELVTVNHELQANIEDASKVNDDLRNLISSTGIASVFVDRALRLKRYTPETSKLFNLIHTDVGRPLSDITHRLDYPDLLHDLEGVMTSLHSFEREVKSASGRWYIVKLQPYRTSEDRIDGAVISFVDVTERRLAVDELKESEQRMQVVADSMKNYAIFTLDLEGVITSWNRGAEHIFGYTSEEAVGRPGEIICTPEDRRTGVLQREMATCREKGQAADDRWHMRKDGRTFYCSGVMTPLTGGLQGYAKIARDLTHVKLIDAKRQVVQQAEREVRQRLEAAAAQKDKFLAIMSHELKNPLNLIQLNAEVLMRSPQVRDIPVVAKASKAIRSSVAGQAQIIDDLLDMSRLNTGKMELLLSGVKLAEVVEHIAAAVQSRADEKHQTLTVKLEAGIELHADPVRVEQIVWNLITNALKFTPDAGAVTVSTKVEGDFARLDVSDSGIGLNAQHLSSIFDMFEQVHTGSSRTRGGLGIGLSLVKSLVLLHGGKVQATSDGIGQGSTFSVWLPLRRATIKVAAETTPSRQSISGLRILLVDDEVETAAIFGELLTLEGAVVTVCSSADEALEVTRHRAFDLILSDLAMPDHDGFWLIAKLRAQPETTNVQVIAVSGLGRNADREKAMTSGFDEHLSKPLQMTELHRCIFRFRLEGD